MDLATLVNYFTGTINFIVKHLGDIVLIVILIVAIYYAYKIFKWFKKRKMKEGGIVNQ